MLYDLSFVNVIMMNAVIPSSDYEGKSDKKGSKKKNKGPKGMNFGNFLKEAKSLAEDE